MYRLRTLGGAALLRDERPLDRIGGQRKLMALLALLAVAGRRGVSRDRIAAHLWPESDAERARGALNQSLHVLRRQFGASEVILGTTELRLNPELIDSDVTAFLEAVEAGDDQRVIAVYEGPFLDGFHLPGATEFEQWAEEQRAVLARHYAKSADALARQAHQRGAYADAADLWRRLQAVDPFSTTAAVGLVEALERAGERGAALRAGQAFEALVREELGDAVDPSVTALLQRLRAAPATSAPAHHAAAAPVAADRAMPGGPPAPADRVARSRPAASRPRRWGAWAAAAMLAIVGFALWQATRRDDGTAGRPDSASVAVIPFVNTNDDAVDGHFADGLTDELISRLGRVRGMRVSARTSSFALRDLGLSARAFADTLGVAAVVEGTVRRQDDRLKITAQLVDPQDNSVLWAESYDRQVRDVIAVQEEIALAIARALQAQLPTRPGTPARQSPQAVDPEAYELYLRGRYDWELPPRERLQQGTRYLLRAVERDPSFATAFAMLAELYVNHAIYAYMPAAEALARARTAADRALALDAELPEALAARAYVRLSELDFDGAEADLRRALAVNSNYAWAHHFLSLHSLMVGREQAAEQHNAQALLLDPLSLPANATRGVVQAQAGRPAAAEGHLARALGLRSDFTLTLFYLGVLRAARGSHEAALVALEGAARQAPEYPGLPGALALTLQALGRSAGADSILAALQARAAADPRARLNLAFAHGAFGRNDVAFSLLDGVRWDVPGLIGLRADPLLAGLRADPRYRELLKGLGAQP